MKFTQLTGGFVYWTTQNIEYNGTGFIFYDPR